MKSLFNLNAKTAFTALSAAAVMLAFNSCQDEDFGYKANEIAFNKAMTELLGTVDPNQDWINAEQGFVIVNSDEDNVKVFDGMTHRIIADYDFVKAGDEIYYNNTIGYKPIISNGVVMAEIEQSGQGISFAAAAPMANFPTGTGKTVSFTRDDCKNIEETLPEEKDNTTKGGVKTNFEFTGNGSVTNGYITFSLYALYWNTAANLEVGVYYYDPSTGSIQDGGVIYKNKRGNTTLKGRRILARNFETIGDTRDSRTYNVAIDYNYQEFQTTGITVTVPANVIFGFYVQQTSDNKLYRYYSNPNLNTDCPTDSKCKTFHAGTFKFNMANKFDSDAICIGFEDWDSDVSDLNDIVFMLEGVELFDYSTDSYTLAFEDLGATNIEDLDFNDCVLQLTATNGKKNANVRLLASGGRLPIKVTYDGNTLISETHAALGQDLVPINANQYYSGVTKDVVNNVTPVAYGLTLESTDWDIKDVVKRFNLEVTRTDKNGEVKAQVHMPFSGGEFPYGFAIKGEFKWPGEQQRITVKYPDFAAWATDPSKNTWYPWDTASADFQSSENNGETAN